MKDLEKAKDILVAGGYTCVVLGKDKVFTSFERGVKPLARWHHQGCNFDGFVAADKVVGKATAFLYVLLNVESIYAGVISKSALKVLEMNGKSAKYGVLVDHIVNRSGDGICPFEKVVMDADDAEIAYKLILEKMKEMNLSLD